MNASDPSETRDPPGPPEITFFAESYKAEDGEGLVVAIARVHADPLNPRSAAGDVRDLARSIAAGGLLQPVVARPRADGDWYVSFGHRRREACLSLGWKGLPIVVDRRERTEAELVFAQAAENTVRANLTPVETWRVIAEFRARGMSDAAAAATLGLDERQFLRAGRLGKLHPSVLAVIEAGNMPGDRDLRILANAPIAEQGEVMQRYVNYPTPHFQWGWATGLLSKAWIPAKYALFDEAFAERFAFTWDEDLFLPAGESQGTRDRAGFRALQEAWVTERIIPSFEKKKKTAVLLEVRDGHAVAPKGVRLAYAMDGFENPAKHTKDKRVRAFAIGDDGELKVYAYDPPEEKPKGGSAAAAEPRGTATLPDNRPPVFRLMSKTGAELGHRAQREAAARGLREEASVVDLLGAALLILGKYTHESGRLAHLLDQDGRLDAYADDFDKRVEAVARVVLPDAVMRASQAVNAEDGNLQVAARIGAGLGMVPALPATPDVLKEIKGEGLEAIVASTRSSGGKTQTLTRQMLARDLKDAELRPEHLPALQYHSLALSLTEKDGQKRPIGGADAAEAPDGDEGEEE